jgi:hypothetical protein
MALIEWSQYHQTKRTDKPKPASVTSAYLGQWQALQLYSGLCCSRHRRWPCLHSIHSYYSLSIHSLFHTPTHSIIRALLASFFVLSLLSADVGLAPSSSRPSDCLINSSLFAVHFLFASCSLPMHLFTSCSLPVHSCDGAPDSHPSLNSSLLVIIECPSFLENLCVTDECNLRYSWTVLVQWRWERSGEAATITAWWSSDGAVMEQW